MIRLHALFIASNQLRFFSGRDMPDFSCGMPRQGDEAPAFRVESRETRQLDPRGVGRLALDGWVHNSRGETPDVVEAGRGCGGEKVTVERKGDVDHLLGVPAKHTKGLEGMCVPEPRSLILRPRRDHVAVRAPCTAGNSFSVPLEDDDLACALAEVPNRQIPVFAARHKAPTVWRECE